MTYHNRITKQTINMAKWNAQAFIHIVIWDHHTPRLNFNSHRLRPIENYSSHLAEAKFVRKMRTESANLHRHQNFNRKWSRIRIWIFRLIWIRMFVRSVPKMLWMHCLIGVSHFAKYRRNRPFIVWEMLTNVQKSPIAQLWKKWKSDPESTRIYVIYWWAS